MFGVPAHYIETVCGVDLPVGARWQMGWLMRCRASVYVLRWFLLSLLSDVEQPLLTCSIKYSHFL
jgi:hypothetical protein